jgi:hypothetical protein
MSIINKMKMARNGEAIGRTKKFSRIAKATTNNNINMKRMKRYADLPPLN